MNNRENIYIFSVYTTKQNARQNYINHETVIDNLKSMGISFKELDGVYQKNSEPSILIVGLEHETLIQKLCALYQQECYLYSDSNRYTSLVYPNSESHIGTLTCVSEIEAKKRVNNFNLYLTMPCNARLF